MTSSQRAIDESVESILEKAEDVAENRLSFGDETAVVLFGSLEKNLQVMMKTYAANNAQDAALAAISGKVSNDTTPVELQAAFTALVAERASTLDEENYEPLKKLRKIIRDSDRASRGGAGPSGSGDADDEELGEDGFAMTQMARSTKCVLLQLEMETSGELRPMMAPCGHVFSFKGIIDHCKKAARGAPAACPMAGCTRKYKASELVEAKDVIKEIKKKQLGNLN